jgi:hypothetical protein
MTHLFTQLLYFDFAQWFTLHKLSDPRIDIIVGRHCSVVLVVLLSFPSWDMRSALRSLWFIVVADAVMSVVIVEYDVSYRCVDSISVTQSAPRVSQ